MKELIEGCIAGAGIGFILGIITMDVNLPYKLALWGIPVGGILFHFFSKGSIRLIVCVLAVVALVFAISGY